MDSGRMIVLSRMRAKLGARGVGNIIVAAAVLRHGAILLNPRMEPQLVSSHSKWPNLPGGFLSHVRWNEITAGKDAG